MSLQIWLPFTKDDSNYGILDMKPTSNTGKKVNSDHGGGYEFNNAEKQCIHYEHNAEINNFKSFSISCWAKSNIAEMRPVLGLTYGIIIYNAGFTALLENESDTIYEHEINTKDTFWHNYILTFNYNLKKFCYYIDGNIIKERLTNNNKEYKILYDNGLYVGYNPNNNIDSNYFNGIITDVRVYNHCLSPLEIKQLSVGLIGHYPLNQFEKSSKNLINWNTILFSSEPYNVEYNNLGNYSYSFKSPATLFRIYNLNMNGDGTKIYTISGYIKSTKDCYAELDLCDTKPIGFNLTSEWIKFIIIRKPINYYDVGNYNGFFDIYVGRDGGIIYVKDVKLEEGENRSPIFIPNYAKDWPQIEYDISGKTNNIPLSEDINPLFVSDTARYSGSYNFNEVGQTIGTREHIKPTKNVSISAWVKSSKIDTVTEPNVDVDGINIYVNNSGIIHLVGTFGDLNSGVSCIDAWTHVCGTYDGTTVKLYVNGVLKSSKSYSSDLKYVKGAAISSDSKSGITCKVSDFRIFSTALKDDYITDLYNMGSAVSSGTLAAYELNE